MMVKTRFRTSLLLALCGLVAGYSLLHLPAATASNRSTKSPASPSATAVTPKVDEPVPTETPPADPPLTMQTAPPQAASLTELESSLQAYVADQPGTWGYFLIDLTTGQTVGMDAETMFPAASTIKLPLALYIMDEVSQGRTRLDELITYQDSDWQDGAGYLAEELSPGSTITVERLVETMIRYSDNVAKNMLTRRFDQDGLFAWIRAQGGQVELRDDGDGGLIYTNAETLGRMMNLLYTDQAFRNAELRQELLTWLETTVYQDRAAAGVPEGVKVAHKIGNLPYVVNDIALVWAPHGPYILAALSEGVFDDDGNATIEALTAMSYQGLEQSRKAQ